MSSCLADRIQKLTCTELGLDYLQVQGLTHVCICGKGGRMNAALCVLVCVKTVIVLLEIEKIKTASVVRGGLEVFELGWIRFTWKRDHLAGHYIENSSLNK